jgi:hypothetical protein
MTSAASDLAPFEDETIFSWKLRHPFIGHTVGMALGSRDRDFGSLRLKQSDIPVSIAEQLRKAAEAPDSWLLRPGKNRQFCPRCLAEDWASGKTPYARRAWRIAWHTCCQQHGLYVLEWKAAELHGFKTAIHAPLVGISYPKWRAPVELHFEAYCKTAAGEVKRVTTFRRPLVGRRAVHLENALSGYTFSDYRRWHPRGLDAATLREVYAAIVKALVMQFSIDLLPSVAGEIDIARQRDPKRFSSAVWAHLGMFYRFIPKVRFSINVLAEAILAEWTKSPLPGEAGSHACTQQLVKAIGWELGAPGTTEPDKCRRTAEPPWEALLRATHPNETARIASKPSSNNSTTRTASKSSSNSTIRAATQSSSWHLASYVPPDRVSFARGPDMIDIARLKACLRKYSVATNP